MKISEVPIGRLVIYVRILGHPSYSEMRCTHAWLDCCLVYMLLLVHVDFMDILHVSCFPWIGN